MISIDLADSDQNGMKTLPRDAPFSNSNRAKQMTCTINRRIADGPRTLWKRTARSRPPKTGSKALARTTASMAIAIRVTDHYMVSWESPRQGQKPGGIPPGNRPMVQRMVVMIREPVVRIQPGRNTSKLGNHRLRIALSITLLCALSGCRPLLWVNTGAVVEAAHLGTKL